VYHNPQRRSIAKTSSTYAFLDCKNRGFLARGFGDAIWRAARLLSMKGGYAIFPGTINTDYTFLG
jgi:hypothetical protein